MQTFDEFIGELRDGSAVKDATELLKGLLEACAVTGKAGTLTFQVAIKPSGMGRVYAQDKITVKAPQAVVEDTLFFLNDENEPQREDPRQTRMEFTKKKAALKTVAGKGEE